jgi:hypothetical protein
MYLNIRTNQTFSPCCNRIKKTFFVNDIMEHRIVVVKTVVWHSMVIMEEERCEPRLNTEFTGHVIISCDKNCLEENYWKRRQLGENSRDMTLLFLPKPR